MLLLPTVSDGRIATFPIKIPTLFNKNTRITLALIFLAILSYVFYSHSSSRSILSILSNNNKKNEPSTTGRYVNTKNTCKYNLTQGPRILCTICYVQIGKRNKYK